MFSTCQFLKCNRRGLQSHVGFLEDLEDFITSHYHFAGCQNCTCWFYLVYFLVYIFRSLLFSFYIQAKYKNSMMIFTYKKPFIYVLIDVEVYFDWIRNLSRFQSIERKKTADLEFYFYWRPGAIALLVDREFYCSYFLIPMFILSYVSYEWKRFI